MICTETGCEKQVLAGEPFCPKHAYQAANSAVEVKTCALCRVRTHSEPIRFETTDGETVRLWLCSPECAWKAGGLAGPVLSLEALRETYDAGGFEVVAHVPP